MIDSMMKHFYTKQVSTNTGPRSAALFLKLVDNFQTLKQQCHLGSVDKCWAVDLNVPGSNLSWGDFFS